MWYIITGTYSRTTHMYMTYHFWFIFHYNLHVPDISFLVHVPLQPTCSWHIISGSCSTTTYMFLSYHWFSFNYNLHCPSCGSSPQFHPRQPSFSVWVPRRVFSPWPWADVTRQRWSLGWWWSRTHHGADHLSVFSITTKQIYYWIFFPIALLDIFYKLKDILTLYMKPHIEHGAFV